MSSNEANAYDVRFVPDVTVSMLVYPNNLNYLHNNRGYFRFILGKNGITPYGFMWLHTAVPVGISHDLGTNPQLFKKYWRRKIVEENS